MSSEELRRSVFSSIHMSSLLRTSNSSITYPSCTFCGGSIIKPRSSPKRKVALSQLSLYTNPSDSFIVWYKKEDEPKGMLWLSSCCVRKGQENTIELISRGCRGRCSYSLKFSCLATCDEWHRLLKHEVRKSPSTGEDDFNNPMDRISDTASLDAMLTDISPLSEHSNYSLSDENSDVGSITSVNSLAQLPTSKSEAKKSSTSRSIKVDVKVKVKPVLRNPLLRFGRTKKTSRPQSGNSFSASTRSSTLGSIENTSLSSPELDWWSWPLRT